MLGICVIFLVGDDRIGDRLLDLCLEQFRRTTVGPSRIYGCPLRMTPEREQRLADAGVELVRPGVPERTTGAREHAMLLDVLTDRAFADGCSHVATFDTDSWPVAAGWDELYLPLVDDSMPLAAMVRTELGDNFPFPAFVLMHRSFWRPGTSSFGTRGRRTFPDDLLARISRASETGSGLLCQLIEEDRPFLRLERSNAWNPHPIMAGLYDDTIFHLGSGSRRPRFVTDTKSYALNDSPVRAAFAEAVNRSIRTTIIRQLASDHDAFVAQLADGSLGPLRPIVARAVELPLSLTLAARGDRRPFVS